MDKLSYQKATGLKVKTYFILGDGSAHKWFGAVHRYAHAGGNTHKAISAILGLPIVY